MRSIACNQSGDLKVETMYTKTNHMMVEIIYVLPQMMIKNKSVTVCADVMYVNKISCFISVAHYLKFRRGQMFLNKKNQDSVGCYTKIFNNL